MSGGASGRDHDPVVAIISAIIAVLAALATLASHHRSIEALSMKNQAILTTAKASDQFTSYQTKRVRVAVYSTLLAGDVIVNAKARSDAKTSLDHEQASSLAVLGEAKRLEDQAAKEQDASERMMASYATLEVGTTLFEIAIVLTSISALTETRVLLWFAVGMAAIGIVLLPIGYFAH